MPTHWVLCAREYCDQCCVSVSWAARSSPMHASWSRPVLIAPFAAATQLCSTFSFGGPSARADKTCDPNRMTANATLPAKANVVLLINGSHCRVISHHGIQSSDICEMTPDAVACISRFAPGGCV